MENIKISTLELENVKRIKALSLEPAADGLTIIGGNNAQGKTSVLDAICWALGGDRNKPSNAHRDGSVLDPHIKITMSNGIVVERSGKNGSLKVIDPTGKRAGQQLLNTFCEELALNLPKFLQSNSREKANTLLQIIGVEEKLAQLDLDIKSLYNRRHVLGQQADIAEKSAKGLPYYADAPSEPVSISELILRQQSILAVNGENQRKRQRVEQIRREHTLAVAERDCILMRVAAIEQDLAEAEKSAEDLRDESTEQIEADIANIEQINVKVRANMDRQRADQDAERLRNEYDSLTGALEQKRSERQQLLDGADLPLPGLSVDEGELTYLGKKWDCMSSSEQLRVGTAIVKALNPSCGFVLLDKLEQMDLNTLRDFGLWLNEQGLQAIATRVSTGDECSIIIEDGEAVKAGLSPIADPAPAYRSWKEGAF